MRQGAATFNLPMAIILLLAVGAGEVLAQGPPPAPVRVAQSATEELAPRQRLFGELVAVNRSPVAAEQTGRLVAVHVETGDAVTGGKTVLAEIESVWAEIELAAARAQLGAAEGELAETEANQERARIDLDYLQELARAKSAKPREVREAEADLKAAEGRRDQARAQVALAEARVRRAETALNKLKIIAPFDGVVVAKLADVGAWADEGDAVVELVSRGKIDAIVDAPQTIVNELTPGSEVELAVDALGERLAATVEAVVPSGDRAARTFPVRLRMSDREGRLKPAMTVTAFVAVGPKRLVVTVPVDAVIYTGNRAAVWQVIEGRARSVAVKVKFRVGDRYVVEPVGGGQALTGETDVIIEGAERLRPGQSVKVVGEGRPALNQAGEPTAPILDQ
ncbi:MAG: efflux RND transporter periplasmic adaptor subunit [Phycisphaeraceae bacterium]|nr:efflux RND transporter periplasmic adaptor subunit [Phycisphaeraceae bacterium]